MLGTGGGHPGPSLLQEFPDSIRITLLLVPWVVPEAGVSAQLEPRVKGGYCHKFHQSCSLSLFGGVRRSTSLA
jgi:hypothetical protein